MNKLFSIILIQFVLISINSIAQAINREGSPLLKDIVYTANDTLKADIYFPENHQQQKNPVLIFANGFGTGDYRKWDGYVAWAKLAATEGFVSILYQSKENKTSVCIDQLLTHVISNSSKYAADIEKISIYAASGNVPKMLPYANKDKRIKAAMIFYGTATMDTFRINLPVLLVRAGFDNSNWNKSIDTLAFKALQSNAPYSVINYNSAVHGFDNDTAPEIIDFMKSSLDFLKANMEKHVQENFVIKENEIIAWREMYHGNWAAALKAFQVSLVNNPGNNETERQTGNVYIELKEYEKALKYFNDALAHGNWRRGEIAKKKCIAYAALNKIEEAVEEMKILKTLGWFYETDYINDVQFKAVVNSGVYRNFVNEKN